MIEYSNLRKYRVIAGDNTEKEFNSLSLAVRYALELLSLHYEPEIIEIASTWRYTRE